MAAQIEKEKLHAIVERLRAGATLISQSTELGFCGNKELRAALKDLLGVDGYDTLMRVKRPLRRTAIRVNLVKRDDTPNRPSPVALGPLLSDTRVCPRCRGRLMPGTSNGFGAFFCVCGWVNVIIPRRPTAEEGASAGDEEPAADPDSD